MNQPKIIFEIGTGQIELVRTLRWWSNSDSETIKCFLFEPLPKFVNQIRGIIQTHGIKNVEIFNVAVHEEEKIMEFFEMGECSFLTSEKNGVHGQSDNMANIEKDMPRIFVQTKNIKDFDKGDIDLLLIDTEGSEWYTIKHLISRPALIVVETHMSLSKSESYRNPFMDEINNWMKENNYILIDKSESDSYFLRADKVNEVSAIRSWTK